MMFTPHPFPYQGSKRRIAGQILDYFPNDVDCLIEPFCGSGAVSLAVASRWIANRFWLNDINEPLMDLWTEILEHPSELTSEYEKLWEDQKPDLQGFFLRIRTEFNATHQPHHLLYLLARIVKGSVRYSSTGSFNQSPDNRRMGMRPETMRRQILATSSLMSGRTKVTAKDFREVVCNAGPDDLVYMDPPYQGTSENGDPRYYSGLPYWEFVDALDSMNCRNTSYIVSYDGWTGSKRHGSMLPDSLSLSHIAIKAGRSTQSTLLGKDDETVESLYLSPTLMHRLNHRCSKVLA